MSALAGKRIVVTRAPRQAGELERLLRERGALPLRYPCIDIAPLNDTRAFDAALQAAGAGAFDWLLLTSANTVQAIAARLEALQLPPTILNGLRVGAVGAATAEAARAQLGLAVDLTPEAFGSSLPMLKKARVLLPQSGLAEPTLAEALTERGAVVTLVEAYQTVVGSGGVDLPKLLAVGEVDAITLTSASTVRYLMQRLNDEGGDVVLLGRLCLTCIGPKTAAAVRHQGLPLAGATPSQPTLERLVAALEAYFAEGTSGGV